MRKQERKAEDSAVDMRGMVKVTSLGCAKNFVDTEVASASFLCAGFGLTSSDADADVQFINTCAFLEEARTEASGVIRSVRSWKESAPDVRRVIVAGCFVEWAEKSELEKFPWVDAWLRIDAVAEADRIVLLDALRGDPAVQTESADKGAWLEVDLAKLTDCAVRFHGNATFGGYVGDFDRATSALTFEGVTFAAQEVTLKIRYANPGKDASVRIEVNGTAKELTLPATGGYTAFAEAEANGEILFIDEGDSLLCSRERARENWEVSQVNTLLSEMERFRGIFIVGTNLIQRLDQAALRRFSFRLHFDYLTSEGKEIFYRMYFKPLRMPELTESEKKSLHEIDQMTPSDFRNVRQQFFYLEDSELTNAEIIEALSAEVASRTSGSRYTGLGKIANRMGF